MPNGRALKAALRYEKREGLGMIQAWPLKPTPRIAG
jgi:hypothetical protein